MTKKEQVAGSDGAMLNAATTLRFGTSTRKTIPVKALILTCATPNTMNPVLFAAAKSMTDGSPISTHIQKKMAFFPLWCTLSVRVATAITTMLPAIYSRLGDIQRLIRDGINSTPQQSWREPHLVRSVDTPNLMASLAPAAVSKAKVAPATGSAEC